MAVERITPYLDKALKALGLHTEARTSFITYVIDLSQGLGTSNIIPEFQILAAHTAEA